MTYRERMQTELPIEQLTLEMAIEGGNDIVRDYLNYQSAIYTDVQPIKSVELAPPEMQALCDRLRENPLEFPKNLRRLAAEQMMDYIQRPIITDIFTHHIQQRREWRHQMRPSSDDNNPLYSGSEKGKFVDFIGSNALRLGNKVFFLGMRIADNEQEQQLIDYFLEKAKPEIYDTLSIDDKIDLVQQLKIFTYSYLKIRDEARNGD